MRRLVALSSTTRTRRPSSSAWRSRGGHVPSSGAQGAERSTWNAEPTPSSLSTRIAPPIAETSRFEIASPSPVPPYRRVVEASTWENERNRRSIRSAGMPMPVSRTEKRRA